MISDISDDQLLPPDEIVLKVKGALQNKEPFFFVRIGDGENFVLSQDSVYPMEKTLAQLWVKLANEGRKGIRLPNIPFRDQMVDSIRKADIVGVLAHNDREIRAHPTHKRFLTNQIFEHFQLRPKTLCNAVVNQTLLRHMPFWQMLREQGARVVLISRWSGGCRTRLLKPPYQLEVPFILKFERNEMMDETLRIMEERRDEYDIVLVSCGVNAVVLCHEIAKRTGKVAIDFGIAMQIMSYFRD